MAMAVPAIPDGQNSSPERRAGLEYLKPEVAAACRNAIRLYSVGYPRREIAKAVAEELYGRTGWPRERKVRAARMRLRDWEGRQWFRDLVYEAAVVELDMSTPQILRGVAAKAKRGRVDAAKLALSLVGRYNDKETAQPAAVTINLVGVPRPNVQSLKDSDEVELAEIVDEEDG